MDAKNGWGERSIALAKEISQLEGDALFFGGDMASNYDDFRKGYEAFASFKGKKVSILGNNCLETLRYSKLTEGHEEEIQECLNEFGFHLLDNQPLVIDGVGFVGNSGWYDGSLFQKSDHLSTEYPTTFDAAMVQAVKHFQEIIFKGKIPDDLTPLAFFKYTYERVQTHLEEISAREDVSKIVLGIHHVPHQDFVLYGKSAKYDFRNFFMGSERFMEFFNHPAVALKFTGHTHRDDYFWGVQNLSSTKNHPYHFFEI